MDSSVVGPMSGTRRKRAKQLRTQSAETPSNNEIGYGHSAHRSLKTPCTRVQMTGATMSSGQREQGTGPVNAGLPPAFPEEHGSGFCVHYCTIDLQPPIHPYGSNRVSTHAALLGGGRPRLCPAVAQGCHGEASAV
jgi:hypothetical protein